MKRTGRRFIAAFAAFVLWAGVQMSVMAAAQGGAAPAPAPSQISAQDSRGEAPEEAPDEKDGAEDPGTGMQEEIDPEENAAEDGNEAEDSTAQEDKEEGPAEDEARTDQDMTGEEYGAPQDGADGRAPKEETGEQSPESDEDGGAQDDAQGDAQEDAQEDADPGSEGKEGTLYIRSDLDGGTIILALSEDEYASRENPSAELFRDEEGNLCVKDSEGIIPDAAPDEDGFIYSIREKYAGDAAAAENGGKEEFVYVWAQALEDQEISVFAVTADGEKEETGFEGEDSSVTEFAYTIPMDGSERILEVQFGPPEESEEVGEDSKDSAVSARIKVEESIVTEAAVRALLAGPGMPTPSADNGTYSGKESAPSAVEITEKNYIEYQEANSAYTETGLGHTGVLTVADTNGYEGLAYCTDPYAASFSVGDIRRSVVKITSGNIVKALYYGQPGFGTNRAAQIAGSADGGKILMHYAVAYYTLACGLNMSSGMEDGDDQHLWNNSSQKLQEDVRAYMNYVESAAMPSGVTAYIVYPGSEGMYGMQSYVYLVKDDREELRLTKKSSLPGITDDNDCYSTKGVSYGVYSDQALGNSVGTLTVNGDGTSNTLTLHTGTYYIRERKAPTGYQEDTEVHAVSLRDPGETYTFEAKDAPVYDDIEVEITKRDRLMPEGGNVQPLKGAEFTVQYFDGYYTGDNLPLRPLRTWTIRTKDRGNGVYSAALSSECLVGGDDLYKVGGKAVLPLGTIVIKESKPAEGYLNDPAYEDSEGNYSGSAYIAQIRQNDGGARMVRPGSSKAVGEDSIKAADTPIFGGVSISKMDLELLKAEALGGASLKGAVFEIYNANTYSVSVGKDAENAAAPGELVTTIVTDEKGNAETTADALQYGTYRVAEKTPPEGYTAAGVTERTVVIGKEGEIVQMTDADSSIQNQVMRGDFHFRKISSGSQDRLAGVQFRITMVKTGESHLITVDRNGIYDSSDAAHSLRTNGGEDGDGLWFALGQDGSEAPVNDALGALPYGEYTYEEIPGDKNSGYRMIRGGFTIYRDKQNVDLGNLEDPEGGTPSIGTVLTDGDGDHCVPAQDKTVLTDVVSYSHFDDYAGKTLTLRGKLVDKKTLEVIAESEKSVKIEAADGKVQMEFEVDASVLAGKSAVAFEYIYENGTDTTPIAKHEDPEDEAQTVFFPSVETHAEDVDTGSATASSGAANNGRVSIRDNVTYTNLVAGKRYTVQGTLMDKESGEPVVDAGGNTVTASKSFVCGEGGSGQIALTFTFRAAQETLGHDAVVFERVTGPGGKEYAVHADLEDKAQTIRFIRIGTTAVDRESGTHTAAPQKDAVIVDHVTYENVVPGTEYTVEGTLVNKESGREITGPDGKPVTASAKFTAEKTSGSVDLTFTLDASELGGSAAVAFERMYESGVEVAVHADLEDEDQTVRFTPDEEPPEPEDEKPSRKPENRSGGRSKASGSVRTGDEANAAGLAAALLTAALAVVILAWKRRGEGGPETQE